MAYSFYRAITVDHTKVANTSQTNFPVLIAGTFAYLATVANGGNVQNASGFDIVFAADSAGASLLSWEVESYSATTGAFIAWVKVPTLSASVDTVFYLLYGNAAISSSQTTATAAWDANYKAVWHFGDGVTLSMADSTSNANTANNFTNNTLAGPTAGSWGGAIALNGSSQYVQVPGNSGLRPTGGLTAQARVKFSAFNAYQHIISMPYYGNQPTWQPPYTVWGIDSGPGPTTGVLRSTCTTNGVETDAAGATALSTGVWYNLALTFDGVTTRIYLNGVQESSNTTSTGTLDYTNLGDLMLGVDASGHLAEFLAGSLDEVRVSSVARSADWLRTESNNQSSPSTFYSISAASGASVARSSMMLLGCGL